MAKKMVLRWQHWLVVLSGYQRTPQVIYVELNRVETTRPVKIAANSDIGPMAFVTFHDAKYVIVMFTFGLYPIN